MARLGLRPRDESRGADRVGTGVAAHPRGRVQARPDRLRHQLMPVRMEFDLVEAIPMEVVGPQDGQDRVGVDRPPTRLFGSGQSAEFRQAVGGVSGSERIEGG